MKYSGQRKLLCEFSKLSKLYAFLLLGSDTKRTLMHLFLFTNSAQRELVSICTQYAEYTRPQLIFPAFPKISVNIQQDGEPLFKYIQERVAIEYSAGWGAPFQVHVGEGGQGRIKYLIYKYQIDMNRQVQIKVRFNVNISGKIRIDVRPERNQLVLL